MRLTNRDIWDGRFALRALANLSPAPTMGVSVRLARNLRKLNAELEDIAAVIRTLDETYQEETEVPDPETGALRTVMAVPASRRASYDAELEELLAQPVDVDVRTISEAELLQCEAKRPGFNLAPGILFGAWFMFDLESEPEEAADGDQPADES